MFSELDWLWGLESGSIRSDNSMFICVSTPDILDVPSICHDSHVVFWFLFDQVKAFSLPPCFLSRGVFQSLVTKHFPSEKQRREKAPGNKRKRKRKCLPLWSQVLYLHVANVFVFTYAFMTFLLAFFNSWLFIHFINKRFTCSFTYSWCFVFIFQYLVL